MSHFTKISTMPKDELIEIIKTENSKLDVLRRLGISPRHGKCGKYLRNFILSNNVDTSHMSAANGLEHRFTYDEVAEWVKKSECWSDVLRASGRKFYGNMIGPMKRLVQYYEIDTSHFDSKKVMGRSRNKISNQDESEIFCENSNVARASLKRYILQHNLIPYRCAACQLGDQWNGMDLVLQIEHKNGIRDDHRLENLCFLCPNCHSQTPTFAGRNWKKEKRQPEDL